METTTWFENMLEQYQGDFEYRLEYKILETTENICRIMKEKNITRSKLAELLKVSKPAVSKILDGNSNFTLKKLLSLADTLDQDLEIRFKDKKMIKSIPVRRDKRELQFSSADGDINIGPNHLKYSDAA
jgi:transcriptional regulator with XRE-family HTH domain